MDLKSGPRTAAIDKRRLRELFRQVEVIREVKAEMPIQMLSVLLIIAMRPGIYQKDLPDMAGLAQSSISRHVRALATSPARDRLGLGLIVRRVGGMGAKTPQLYLNAAGKALLGRLMGA